MAPAISGQQSAAQLAGRRVVCGLPAAGKVHAPQFAFSEFQLSRRHQPMERNLEETLSLQRRYLSHAIFGRPFQPA